MKVRTRLYKESLCGKPLWSCWLLLTEFAFSPVVRSESVRNIIRERRMLEHVNHPFICNLRYSFQDIEYMYDSPPQSISERDMNDILTVPTGTWWLI